MLLRAVDSCSHNTQTHTWTHTHTHMNTHTHTHTWRRATSLYCWYTIALPLLFVSAHTPPATSKRKFYSSNDAELRLSKSRVYCSELWCSLPNKSDTIIYLLIVSSWSTFISVVCGYADSLPRSVLQLTHFHFILPSSVWNHSDQHSTASLCR